MSNPFEQIMSNPELFKVASTHHFHGNECLCGFVSPVSRQRTEHIMTETIAAALPEVTSVEELEALPEGTILRDSYGLALHKRTANWWVTNCDSNLTSEDLADEIADTAHTYTVLYRPEVKP